MSSLPQVFLISGANRGLGLGLVGAVLSKQPDAFIYAGARDPDSAADLRALVHGHPGRLEIVKCVSGDEEGNRLFAKRIKEQHGRVDVVIANAGISNWFGRVEETPIHQLQEHFEVNVAGVVVLFQAVYSLLKASSTPKFIPISTHAGSLVITLASTAGYTSYGASKAALNWISRKIHFENEWIVCFPLAPGGVDTDMARAGMAMDTTGALTAMMAGTTFPVDVAANNLINLISNATREKEGGEFIVVDGSKLPW